MDDRTQWAASRICRHTLGGDQCLALNNGGEWICHCGKRDAYLGIALAALAGADEYDRLEVV